MFSKKNIEIKFIILLVLSLTGLFVYVVSANTKSLTINSTAFSSQTNHNSSAITIINIAKTNATLASTKFTKSNHLRLY